MWKFGIIKNTPVCVIEDFNEEEKSVVMDLKKIEFNDFIVDNEYVGCTY